MSLCKGRKRATSEHSLALAVLVGLYLARMLQDGGELKEEAIKAHNGAQVGPGSPPGTDISRRRQGLHPHCGSVQGQPASRCTAGNGDGSGRLFQGAQSRGRETGPWVSSDNTAAL